MRYSFAHRTAEFLLCGICGVYIAAVMAAEQGTFAALNLNTVATAMPDLPPAEPVSYESESREERILRRQSRWTPVEGAA